MSSPEPFSPPPKKKPTSRLKFNRLEIKRNPAPAAVEKGSSPAAVAPTPASAPAASALDFFNRAKDVYVPPLPKKRRTSEDPEGKEGQVGPNKRGKKEKGEGEVKTESKSRKSTVVNLDSDSDDDITKPLKKTTSYKKSSSPVPKSENRRSSRTSTAASSTPVHQEPKSLVVSLDSESEDDELVIIDSSIKKAAAPTNIPTPTPEPPKAPAPYIPNAEQRRLARMQQQISSAPVVNILITSPIDKTTPLIIKRKLDQTLREAREHWCRMQNFSPEQTETIFLVWKRSMRVSDYVSCQSLNIAVDENGRGNNDGEGWNGGNVHFEAMTTEIFNRIEAGEELEDEDEEEKQQKRQKEEDEERMSLVLKTKGNKEEFKIKVRPNTTIAELIQAYRTAQKVGDEKKVVLYFEGDHLDPDDTVTDADLEDMCMVDVHIN
ncbi:Similar to hypothetical protein CIMG_07255 [Coccidioides immitis RS]; acc. no. XP_001243359 [Pyronema omphalodes CBS 100304]|uniref:Ubiquitin-like domain-containing protein n=1 Tax=Pyronema omphalodes (strain CBS 100304) TaxID=1076935 RepID=U4LFK4_PYROM|nr:Similar to hypothetical protein CIMG_07255 [Coccidioides immitis RS]; acc. no. XP_001243359 [Pyronema omphalodes CBS 100304]